MNSEQARERMIRRQNRSDPSRTAPKVNEGPDMGRFMQSQRPHGLNKLCNDPELIEKLQEAAGKVWAIFGERIAQKNCNGLFLYSPKDQTGDYWNADGITCLYGPRNGTARYKIGIASSAVNAGEQYLLMVLIHEVAHVIHFDTYRFDHPPEWHALLDSMLAEFTSASGIELKNDYSSFNGEYSFRPEPRQPWINRKST